MQASCKAGAPCTCFFSGYHCLKIKTNIIPFAVQLRCSAPHHDLDGELRGPCSHLLTETLMHSGMITLQELWDDYRIVGEILVSIFKFNYSQPVSCRCRVSHLRQLSCVLISTKFLHRTSYTSLSKAHSRTTLSPG